MSKEGEKAVNVTVAVRIRPINVYQNLRDLSAGVDNDNPTMVVRPSLKNQIVVYDPSVTSKSNTFTFDYVFDSMTSGAMRSGGDQATIYQELGQLVLGHAMQGYNTCLFVYGQTGSGKTYTITGFEDPNIPVIDERERQGLIPRILDGLCRETHRQQTETRIYRVEMSYYEIYNEKVQCLLDPDPAVIYRVREHPEKGPFVVDLKVVDIQSHDDFLRCIRRAAKNRHTAATKMNETSSRSHSVCSVTVYTTVFDPSSGELCETVSKMNLVDLAGSERSSTAGTSGQRLMEGSSINRSLLTLGNVIEGLAAMAEGSVEKRFIPYRESTLTWLLKEALGGNSKTVMLACVSPNPKNYDESLNTLKYADRAKSIKNVATINVDSRKQLLFNLKEERKQLHEEIAKMKTAAESSKIGANTDAIILPRKCPFLLQLAPLPALRDAFIYYLSKDEMMITNDTSLDAVPRGHHGIISLQGMGVCQNHVQIGKIHGGEGLEIRSLAEKIRVKDNGSGVMRDVSRLHLPENLSTGDEFDVGSYTFKVINPLQSITVHCPEERALAKVLRDKQEKKCSADDNIKERLGKIIDTSSIGSESLVLARKGVEGEICVFRAADGVVNVVEWVGNKWEEAEIDSAVIDNVVSAIADQVSSSTVIAAILGDSFQPDILPYEHELPAPKNVDVTETRLVRGVSYKGCVVAVRWDTKGKAWLRASQSEAEACCLREVENQRTAQYKAAIEEMNAKMTDLASVRARAAESAAEFNEKMNVFNEAIRVAQMIMQCANQDVALVEQRQIDGLTAHEQRVDAINAVHFEKMEDAESNLCAMQQTYSQLSETYESKTMNIEAKVTLLRAAEESRDATVSAVRAVKDQIAVINRDIEKVEKEGEELIKEIERMKCEREAYSIDKFSLNKQLDAEVCITDEECMTKVVSLRRDKTESLEQESQLYRNLARLSESCEEGRQKNLAYEERLEQLQREEAELNEKIAHDTGEINKTLTERYVELNDQLSRAQILLDEAKRQNVSQAASQEAEINEAREDERRVLMAKQAIQDEQHHRTLSTSRSAQQSNLRQLQKERNKARETLQATMVEREGAKSRLKHLESLSEKRDKEASALRDELAGCLTKLQVCKQDAERRANQIEKVEATHMKIKLTNARIAEVQKVIRSMKREEEDARNEARLVKEQQAKLRGELDALMTKLRAADKEVKQCRTEGAEYKRDAAAIQLRLDDMRLCQEEGGSVPNLKLPRRFGVELGVGFLTPGTSQPGYMRGTQSSYGKIDSHSSNTSTGHSRSNKSSTGTSTRSASTRTRTSPSLTPTYS